MENGDTDLTLTYGPRVQASAPQETLKFNAEAFPRTILTAIKLKKALSGIRNDSPFTRLKTAKFATVPLRALTLLLRAPCCPVSTLLKFVVTINSPGPGLTVGSSEAGLTSTELSGGRESRSIAIC